MEIITKINEDQIILVIMKIFLKIVTIIEILEFLYQFQKILTGL